MEELTKMVVSHKKKLYWIDCDHKDYIKTNICERFHKTILQEFYQVTLRKKIYMTIEELQNDLDEWLQYYNNERTHQGKMCCGRTPMQTLVDGKRIWMEKSFS